jgi:hypothetical protein
MAQPNSNSRLAVTTAGSARHRQANKKNIAD